MTIIEEILSKINTANLAISKESLIGITPKNCRIEGYILSKVDYILDNIKNISMSKSSKVIINKNLLYQDMNDDFKNYGILFVIEGSRDFKDITAKQIVSNIYEIKDINELMSDEVLSLKRGIFKKYLWNKDNIVKWAIMQNIGLTVDMINNLSENWSFFKEEVLKKDSESFYQNSKQEDKINALFDFQNRSILLIKKYKRDIFKKIFNIWHEYTKVNIINPTIIDIYANQKYASLLNKKYPKLNINFLSDKAFKEFALN